MLASSGLQVAPPALLRPLGWLEATLVELDWLVVNVAILACTLDNRSLSKAVEATSQRHPLLRANVCRRDQESGYQFRSLANWRIEPKFVIANDDSQWKVIVEEEMNRGYDVFGNGALWKVVAISLPQHQTTVLATGFHHCIGDGTSGMVLFNGNPT